MKYKTCTEYWLDTSKNTFRGEFEEMYRDIEDPWGCLAATSELNNRLFVEILLAHAPYKKGLDIGCGLGGLTQLIYKKLDGIELVGCDISASAIKKAKMSYPEIRFERFDVLSQDVSTLGKFDLIVLSELLWYVLESLERFMEKIQMVLTPNGCVAIHQYFPAEQKYGKNIVQGCEGFEKWMADYTPLCMETKVACHVDDGIVLLAIYRCGGDNARI